MGTHRRVVAGVVALALATLPGSVAVCAVLCASSGSSASVTAGSSAHAHHTSEATHHDRSDDPRVRSRAASTHPCGDHDANLQLRKAKLTPPATDTGGLWACEAPRRPQGAIGQLIAPDIGWGHGAPPGPSRTTTPLVLRI